MTSCVSVESAASTVATSPPSCTLTGVKKPVPKIVTVSPPAWEPRFGTTA